MNEKIIKVEFKEKNRTVYLKLFSTGTQKYS